MWISETHLPEKIEIIVTAAFLNATFFLAKIKSTLLRETTLKENDKGRNHLQLLKSTPQTNDTTAVSEEFCTS